MVSISFHQQNGRDDRARLMEDCVMTSNSNANTAPALSDAELDIVTGGSGPVGMSVQNQEAIARKEELTAAFLANHPIQLGPFHLPH
jgi:hypothetical protein